MAKKRPTLSIVIPTAFEKVEYLTECLQKLEENTKMDYEVIVVLNGQQPKSKAIAESFNAVLIEFDENKGYAPAMNAGFEKSRGKYLVGLNNDVLVSEYWDIRLREGLDDYHERKNPFPRAGLTGPVTNNAGGIQGINVQGVASENYEGQVAPRVYEDNIGNIIPHSVITGFCFMMPRDFYEEMIETHGHFYNEIFPVGGAEDNQICVDAMRLGWNIIVNPQVFVYHYGQRTLRSIDKSYGVNNLYYLYKAYEDDRSEILGALYRIKLTKDYHVEDWLRSLEKTYEFSDRIYILDDNSDEDLWDEAWSVIMEKYGHEDAKPITVKRRLGEQKLEGEDRQELYKMAYDDGCDWVISVDGDEIFEDKFDYEYAHRLMNNPNPQINGYIFHWYHLWNNEDYWRSDGNRGKTMGARMVRCLPNFKIPKRAFHTGNIPELPGGSCQMTSVRIKHLGQMRKTERERKTDYYNKQDDNPQPELIGHHNYDHISDETNVHILPWQEDNEITVTTIMKNEETGLHSYFSRVWAFADEIVLVDTGSTDRSKEIAEIFGCKVLDFEWQEDFSAARNFGLKHCSKDWILHVDIDESIKELQKVRRMVEWPAAEGFLFYVYNPQPSGKAVTSETVRLMRNNGKWYYKRYVHETTDDAMEEYDMKVFRATTEMIHTGFLKDKEEMKGKLANYLRMNLRQLKDDPKDASANYNAAMHFLDAGHKEIAEYLMERALRLNPKFFQAANSLMYLRIDDAFHLARHIKKILPDHHNNNPEIQRMLNVLEDIRDKPTPIDKTHVADVLSEEEFMKIGNALSKVAERRKSGVSLDG